MNLLQPKKRRKKIDEECGPNNIKGVKTVMEMIDPTNMNIALAIIMFIVLSVIYFILKLVKKIVFKIIGIASVIATGGYFML